MDIERLRELISDQFSSPAVDNLSEDTTFEELGMDSLDLADIVMNIERELEIEIDPDILEEIVTVGDALEAIQEAQKQA